jgi:hypothetical protein
MEPSMKRKRLQWLLKKNTINDSEDENKAALL